VKTQKRKLKVIRIYNETISCDYYNRIEKETLGTIHMCNNELSETHFCTKINRGICKITRGI